MQRDTDIRLEARRLIWGRNWFWKLLVADFLLQACSQLIVMTVNMAVYSRGVFNITALMHLKSQNMPLPELTPRIMWEFSSSSLLYLFFALITGGIAVYGHSVLLLRSVEDKQEGWLKAAFSGFKTPLELAWLSFRLSLAFLPWTILAAIPCAAIVGLANTTAYAKSDIVQLAVLGLCTAICLAVLSVPFYRYRYLFRLKADHPEWSAGMCMKTCREITKDRKWQIFRHDCLYWRSILAALVCLAVYVADILVAKNLQCENALTGMIAQISNSAFVIMMMITVQYVGVGQTILYREQKSERDK